MPRPVARPVRGGSLAVAQQLHRLARKGVVVAAPEFGNWLIGVVGCSGSNSSEDDDVVMAMKTEFDFLTLLDFGYWDTIFPHPLPHAHTPQHPQTPEIQQVDLQMSLDNKTKLHRSQTEMVFQPLWKTNKTHTQIDFRQISVGPTHPINPPVICSLRRSCIYSQQQ